MAAADDTRFWRIVLIGCGVPILLVVICCSGLYSWFQFEDWQHAQLRKLLEGNAEYEIKSLTLDVRRARIELRDPETVQFLTRAFRSAEYEGHSSSRHCEVHTLATVLIAEGALEVGLEFDSDGESGLLVSVRSDPLYFYWVPFTKPLPKPLADALKQVAEMEIQRKREREQEKQKRANPAQPDDQRK